MLPRFRRRFNGDGLPIRSLDWAQLDGRNGDLSNRTFLDGMRGYLGPMKMLAHLDDGRKPAALPKTMSSNFAKGQKVFKYPPNDSHMFGGLLFDCPTRARASDTPKAWTAAQQKYIDDGGDSDVRGNTPDYYHSARSPEVRCWAKRRNALNIHRV